jgi:hypothetical protein
MFAEKRQIPCLGDGNCAYNTIALGLIDKIMYRTSFPFSPETIISNNYHDLLDLVNSDFMPPRNDSFSTVDSRFTQFLSNLSEEVLGTKIIAPNFVKVQQQLASALREYVHRSLNNKNNVNTKKYIENIDIQLNNILEDWDTHKDNIPDEFSNIPEIKEKICEILNEEGVRTAFAEQYLKRDQVQIIISRKNLVFRELGMPETKGVDSLEIAFRQLLPGQQELITGAKEKLRDWFDSNYHLYLKNEAKTGISDPKVYVGVNEYKVLAPLLGLEIMYYANTNQRGGELINEMVAVQKIYIQALKHPIHWDILFEKDALSEEFFNIYKPFLDKYIEESSEKPLTQSEIDAILSTESSEPPIDNKGIGAFHENEDTESLFSFENIIFYWIMAAISILIFVPQFVLLFVAVNAMIGSTYFSLNFIKNTFFSQPTTIDGSKDNAKDNIQEEHFSAKTFLSSSVVNTQESHST